MYWRILGTVVMLCLLVVASRYAFRSGSPNTVVSAGTSASGSSPSVINCGIEQYEFGAGYDAQKRECFSSAFAAGASATFSSVHRATEGAFLTYAAVVAGRSQIEVTFGDKSPGENGGTFHYSCSALERRPINDQPSRLSLAAMTCSGRGPEVVF